MTLRQEDEKPLAMPRPGDTDVHVSRRANARKNWVCLREKRQASTVGAPKPGREWNRSG